MLALAARRDHLACACVSPLLISGIGLFAAGWNTLGSIALLQPDPRLLRLFSICGSRFDGPLRSTYWWACSRFFRAEALSPMFPEACTRNIIATGVFWSST